MGSLGSRPTQGGGCVLGEVTVLPPARAAASAGTRSGEGIPRGQPEPEFSIEHPGKYERTTSGVNEIVDSDTGRQPSGAAALPCEGELSRLRSGGTGENDLSICVFPRRAG